MTTEATLTLCGDPLKPVTDLLTEIRDRLPQTKENTTAPDELRIVTWPGRIELRRGEHTIAASYRASGADADELWAWRVIVGERGGHILRALNREHANIHLENLAWLIKTGGRVDG